METPLTPMEFARRARSLYGDRLAVVDGDLRLTYEQLFDRCDRWSHVLQSWGVRPGAQATEGELRAFARASSSRTSSVPTASRS